MGFFTSRSILSSQQGRGPGHDILQPHITDQQPRHQRQAQADAVFPVFLGEQQPDGDGDPDGPRLPQKGKLGQESVQRAAAKVLLNPVEDGPIRALNKLQHSAAPYPALAARHRIGGEDPLVTLGKGDGDGIAHGEDDGIFIIGGGNSVVNRAVLQAQVVPGIAVHHGGTDLGDGCR